MACHIQAVTMGDIRFSMIGIGLIFSGFVVLGVFGGNYQSASIESEEFGTCYRYSEGMEPVSVSCAEAMAEQAGFLGGITALIAAGIASLVKGVRGDWDSKVRPEDMVGPSSGGGGAAGHHEDKDGGRGSGKYNVGAGDAGDNDGKRHDDGTRD